MHITGWKRRTREAVTPESREVQNREWMTAMAEHDNAQIARSVEPHTLYLALADIQRMGPRPGCRSRKGIPALAAAQVGRRASGNAQA